MHILTARSSAARPTAPAYGAPTLTIPVRLLAEFGANALAIGLYCLIARLYLIRREPVPISAADLAGYDPGASGATVGRALRRLEASGWIIAERPANKKAYRPAWGPVAEAPRPWQLGAKCLGRPGHIATAPFDSRLLDVCLGRIEPTRDGAPPITRYLTAPLLSLRDIGAYLRAGQGRGRGTPALVQLGLIVDGLPRQLGDIAELLAAANQRHLANPSAPALTEHGLRMLGIDLPEEPPAPAEPPAPGQTLVFLTPEQYRRLRPQIAKICARFDRGLIGGLITLEGPETAPEIDDLAALEADNPIEQNDAGDWTGILNDSDHESSMVNGPEEGQFYVKYASPEKPKRAKKKRSEPLPDTPTVRRLRELDISIKSVRELQDMPLEIIDIILNYARSRDNIANLAGWLVATLRDARDNGWKPERFEVRNPGGEPLELEKYTHGKFAVIFMRDQGYGVPECAGPRVEPESATWYRPESIPAMEDDLLFTLRYGFPEDDHALISRLELIEVDGDLALGCRTAADLRLVEERLAERLAWACEDLHWPAPPRLVVGRGAAC